MPDFLKVFINSFKGAIFSLVILTCLIGAGFLLHFSATSSSLSPEVLTKGEALAKGDSWFIPTALAQNDVDPSQDQFGLADQGFSKVGVASERDIKDTIAQIINIALGFLGVVAVGLIIYAGFLWMTAGGNEDQIKRAKLIIRNAVIGLVIIFASWAIATFVINRLRDAAQGGGGGGPCEGPGCGGGGGLLPPGAFILSSMQTANQSGNPKQDVYLCSSVQAQFNHWVDNPSFIEAQNQGHLTIVRYLGGDYVSGAPTPITPGLQTDLRNNSITFTKTDGQTDNPVRVDLEPNSLFEARLAKILKDTDKQNLEDCEDCDGDTDDYFFWRFATGTTTDAVAPTLADHYPQADQAEAERSIVFSLQFSEPVLATSLIGQDSNLLTGNVLLEQLDGQGGAVVSSFANLADHFDAAIAEKRLDFVLNKKQQAVFDGKPLLEPLAWYRLTVQGVKDLCGNPMAKQTFEFMTGDQTPGVSFVRPSEGYEYACPASDAFAQFRTSMYSVRTQSCAVGVGLVNSGQLRPTVGGALISLNPVPGDDYYQTDNVTPRPGYPNDYCRHYAFALDTIDLNPNTQYSAQVAFSDLSGGQITKDWAFGVKTAGECADEPYITSLTPRQGAWGRCLTASGRNFGQDKSAGNVKSSLELTSARNNLPNPLAMSTLDFWQTGGGKDGFNTGAIGLWTDSSITTDAGNLNTGPSAANLPRPKNIDTGLTVSVDHGSPIGILKSNPARFYVDSDSPYTGPCLDAINPESGAWGDNVTLSGRRLGNGDNSSLEFFNQKSQTNFQWSDASIQSTVPNGAEDGNVFARVNGVDSNPLPFDVAQGAGQPCSSVTNACVPSAQACGQGLSCSQSCVCQPDGKFRITTSYPSSQCTNNCANAVIGFAADQDLNVAVPSHMIQVLPCVDSACSSFDNDILNNINFPTAARAVLNTAPLQTGKSYRVVVGGGTAGLQSADGKTLANLNYDFNKDGALDSYSWTFPVGQGICVVDRVEVNPDTALLYAGNTQMFSATAYSRSDSCDSRGQLLNTTSGFNWGGFSRSANGSAGNECFSSAPETQLSITAAPEDNYQASALANQFNPGEIGDKLDWICARNSDKVGASPIVLRAPCISNEQCAAGGACAGSTCSAGVCQPVVNSFAPAAGAVGSWVTINGCYFGNNWGQVKFGSLLASQPNPFQCGSSTWSDEQIIAEVPLAAGTAPITVIRPDGESANSNNLVTPNFTVNTTVLPAICRVAPRQGRPGILLNLSGKNFGTLAQYQSRVYPGANNASYAVLFTDLATSTPIVAVTDVAVVADACPAGGWSGNNICIAVAGAAPVGNGKIKVRANNQVSAGYNFRVIDNSIPENAVNIRVNTYSPGDGHLACLNTVVGVGLNTLLDQSTLPAGFMVRPQGGAAITGTASALDKSGHSIISFTPGANLTASTSYEMVLVGGLTGLRSASGGILEQGGVCQTLDSAGNCVIEFATVINSGDSCDDIPPGAVNIQVTAYSPGANNLACLNMIPEVSVNTGLNEATLTSDNFFVRQGGAAIAGTVSSRERLGTKIISFTPEHDLAAGQSYEIVLAGGGDGLRSASGGILEAGGICQTLTGVDCVILFATVGDGQAAECELDKVSLEPQNPTFFCAGDNCAGDQDAAPGHQRVFTAALKNKAGQNVNVSYGWSSGDPTILSVQSAGTLAEQKFTIARKNGSSVISAAVTGTNLTGQSEARVFICANPWVGPNPPYYGAPYFDSGIKNANFSTFYCRDKGNPGTGDDLPALNNPIDSSNRIGVPDLFKELFFIQPVGNKTCTAGGNNGTLTNMSPSSWVDGKYGRALRFDGTDDRVEIADSNNLDITDAITVSAWIKLRRYPTPNAQSGHAWQILSKGGGTTQSMVQWYIGNDTNVGEGVVNFYATIGGVWIGGRSTSKLPLNEWVFVSSTYDGQQIVNYLNGAPTPARAVSGPLYANQFPLKIGTGINGDYVDGDIDEVRLYNRALSAGEVQQLFALTSGQLPTQLGNGLVGYWPFDDGEGVIAGSGVSSTGKQCQLNSECGAGSQCVGASDAVGVRVIANPENYSVQEWYSRQTFTKGDPRATTIDGYEALQDGNTIYVNAPNDTDPNSSTATIYSNIYVISMNGDAHPDTANIYSQLAANWRFAANITSLQDRNKIRRDTVRLSDASKIVDLINNSSSLPQLVSGTFEQGLSLSVWPSWPQTLSPALGVNLPVDPINEINCASFPTLDQDTCWDPTDPKYQCEADSSSKKSRFYSYEYASERATVGLNLEYKPGARIPAGWTAVTGNSCRNLQYIR